MHTTRAVKKLNSEQVAIRPIVNWGFSGERVGGTRLTL